jgi:hypothetical protein
MENDSHSPVVAILNDAKAKAKAIIKAKQAEIADIDRALAALSLPALTAQKSPQAKTSKASGHVSVTDAIVMAVEAGQNNPTDILAWVQLVHNVQTTFGSVRASLSNLKAKGRIRSDHTGWLPINKTSPEDLFSPDDDM